MNTEFDPLKNFENTLLALFTLLPWELSKIESEYINSISNSLLSDFYGSHEEYIHVHESIWGNQEISKEDICIEYHNSKSNGTNPGFVTLIEDMILKKKKPLD